MPIGRNMEMTSLSDSHETEISLWPPSMPGAQEICLWVSPDISSSSVHNECSLLGILPITLPMLRSLGTKISWNHLCCWVLNSCDLLISLMPGISCRKIPLLS